MQAIVNTKLIMEDGIIWDGAITFEGGVIRQVGPAQSVTIPANAAIIDAKGKYTAPGLIDIHNHGAGEATFDKDPLGCAAHFLSHGETTVLPAFYMNLTREEMLAGAKRVREASRHGAGRILKGLYMEGPYMGAFGSYQSGLKWNGPIDEADYRALVDGIGEMARVWAVDPAREGIEGFMAYVKAVNPRAIFALGHSKATAAMCKKVKHYGVKVQTHHGDSGKAKGFAQGTIGAGCDEFTLYDPDMYAELISDENGIHVAPDMIKMVVRVKGVERIILISDSMPGKADCKNNEAAGIAYGADLNYDDEGYLAGSRLTLDCACRNLMKHTGYGLCHAIRFATLNPARLLGIDDEVGSLEEGKAANLIIMDDMVRVEQVVLEGEAVHPLPLGNLE